MKVALESTDDCCCCAPASAAARGLVAQEVETTAVWLATLPGFPALPLPCPSGLVSLMTSLCSIDGSTL
jgi:hypothetical protein